MEPPGAALAMWQRFPLQWMTLYSGWSQESWLAAEEMVALRAAWTDECVRP
ncbi:MAG: hypothetical protein ACLP0H_02940 [Terriglobales bacterium]